MNERDRGADPASMRRFIRVTFQCWKKTRAIGGSVSIRVRRAIFSSLSTRHRNRMPHNLHRAARESLALFLHRDEGASSFATLGDPLPRLESPLLPVAEREQSFGSQVKLDGDGTGGSSGIREFCSTTGRFKWKKPILAPRASPRASLARRSILSTL